MTSSSNRDSQREDPIHDSESSDKGFNRKTIISVVLQNLKHDNISKSESSTGLIWYISAYN